MKSDTRLDDSVTMSLQCDCGFSAKTERGLTLHTNCCAVYAHEIFRAMEVTQQKYGGNQNQGRKRQRPSTAGGSDLPDDAHKVSGHACGDFTSMLTCFQRIALTVTDDTHMGASPSPLVTVTRFPKSPSGGTH